MNRSYVAKIYERPWDPVNPFYVYVEVTDHEDDFVFHAFSDVYSDERKARRKVMELNKKISREGFESISGI